MRNVEHRLIGRGRMLMQPGEWRLRRYPDLGHDHACGLVDLVGFEQDLMDRVPPRVLTAQHDPLWSVQQSVLRTRLARVWGVPEHATWLAGSGVGMGRI
jgi:hypothetical protein